MYATEGTCPKSTSAEFEVHLRSLYLEVGKRIASSCFTNRLRDRHSCRIESCLRRRSVDGSHSCLLSRIVEIGLGLCSLELAELCCVDAHLLLRFSCFLPHTLVFWCRVDAHRTRSSGGFYDRAGG
jgi:hypothetical protein